MGKIIDSIKKTFAYKENQPYNFILSNATVTNTSASQISEKLYIEYDKNLNYIKDKYSTLINSDVKIREFYINVQNKKYKSFLFYIDGMIDSKSINDFVLNPLMLKNKTNSSTAEEQVVTNPNKVIVVKPFDLQTYIMDSLIPQNDVSVSNEFSRVISQVSSGVSALFIDTLSFAFLIDAKGFEKRSISIPQNEFVIRGSQEGFVEAIRVNTSLIRRLINSEDLIIENTTIGKINKNTCCICYMKNIANPDLVAEVKYRINNLAIDSIFSSGKLEQLIKDSPSSVPQMISTERPDRVANYLIDGRVAILINGSPYALVAPGVFTDFLASSEDRNLQYQFANLLRIIRLIAITITLTLPGFYIAITTFHQEIIPTELLFAIVSSRNAVPFPIIFEILIMDVCLELIRESRYQSSIFSWTNNRYSWRVNFRRGCC